MEYIFEKIFDFIGIIIDILLWIFFFKSRESGIFRFSSKLFDFLFRIFCIMIIILAFYLFYQNIITEYLNLPKLPF